MPTITFNNPETAKQFETDFETDPRLEVPGKTPSEGWNGNLSDIPPFAAKNLVAQKSNLVREKALEAPKAPATKAVADDKPAK
jgi:hypothetical protein